MTKKKRFGISKDLSESLSHTVEVATNNAGSLRYEIVPVSNIELDPENPRDLLISKYDVMHGIAETDSSSDLKKKEIDSLSSLAHSISIKGLINPIWIYKFGSNYRLLVGERRMLATILAGIEQIPAKIMEEKPVEYDLRLLQWIENIEREDLTLWEKIVNLKQIISAKKARNPEMNINATVIKKILGCSLPHAMNYLAVLSAPEKILKEVENGKINSIEKIALLSNASKMPIFDNVFAKCLQGTSIKRMQHLLKDFKQSQPSLHVAYGSSAPYLDTRSIALGITSSSLVVKEIVEAILLNPKYSQHSSELSCSNWNDKLEAATIFKKLVRILEKNNA